MKESMHQMTIVFFKGFESIVNENKEILEMYTILEIFYGPQKVMSKSIKKFRPI